jgi:hypothetical protein
VANVTYKNQPAIDKTKGNVPLAGTSHIYRVRKRLWNDSIEDVLRGLWTTKKEAERMITEPWEITVELHNVELTGGASARPY